MELREVSEAVFRHLLEDNATVYSEYVTSGKKNGIQTWSGLSKWQKKYLSREHDLFFP